MDSSRKHHRGERTFEVLAFLMKGSLTFRALLLAHLKSSRSVSQLRSGRIKELRRSENDYYDFLERQNFYKLIWRLKKEGLIENKNKAISITTRGATIFSKLSQRLLPSRHYPNEKDGKLKIVTFDISEKERHKRHWLRSVLRNLDFYKLQQSVWIGKNKLPVEFIKDLKTINILSNVHIFSISEEGTLSEFPINLS